MKPIMKMTDIVSTVALALATANAEATLVNAGIPPSPPGAGLRKLAFA